MSLLISHFAANLAPGGSISDEGDSDGPISTDICVFKQPGGGRETIKAWYEVRRVLLLKYCLYELLLVNL